VRENAWGRPVLLFKNSWKPNQLNEDHPELRPQCLASVVSVSSRSPSEDRPALSHGTRRASPESITRKVTTVPEPSLAVRPCRDGAVINVCVFYPFRKRPKCTQGIHLPPQMPLLKGTANWLAAEEADRPRRDLQQEDGYHSANRSSESWLRYLPERPPAAAPRYARLVHSVRCIGAK